MLGLKISGTEQLFTAYFDKGSWNLVLIKLKMSIKFSSIVFIIMFFCPHANSGSVLQAKYSAQLFHL